ncbi:MAG: hypothetical protein LBI99_05435, partial [Propionibacteriaceae bacterium]|nr:hypothetical protein [Propionibacteriaceae bacterium]
MTAQYPRDQYLASQYQNRPGPVAFADETMLAKLFKRGDIPFYAMAAATFDRNSLDTIRDELLELVGGDYWHATEAYALGHYDQITEMAEHVAARAEWNIVTVEMPLPKGGSTDKARQTCLAALAKEVTRGTGPGAVRLIVAERNKTAKLNHLDQKTMHTLRQARDIHQDVAFT